MPLVEAFPLGLILSGTTSTILADGSSSYKLMAMGTAAVGSEKRAGTILLNLGAGPCNVLIGMEFLASFAKTLFVHQKAIVLIDNIDVEEVVMKALDALETQRKQLSETNKNSQS